MGILLGLENGHNILKKMNNGISVKKSGKHDDAPKRITLGHDQFRSRRLYAEL